MKIRIILLGIIGMLSIISCKPKLDTAGEELYAKVMEVHDEVMPKMRDIHKAKKALKKLKTDANSTAVDQMVKKLDMADEAMMSWMHDFDKPDGKDVEATMKYLNEEMVKVTNVKDVMLSSISEAQALIDKMKGNE